MSRTSRFVSAGLEFTGGLCLMVAIFATFREDRGVAAGALLGCLLFTMGKWFTPENL